MKTTLKLAVVGLGRIGKHHAQTLAWRTRHCEVIAVCSPVAAELAWAQAELAGLTASSCYDDYEVLLRDPKIEAVVLATPTSLHAEQVKAALAAGKHVFTEKPLALNTADCEAVAAVAQKYPQQIVMTGFVRRFDHSYQQAKNDISAGLIGQPYLVRSQTCDLYDPSGFFVRFAPTSGGIYMDCSIHDIDLARWLLTSPASGDMAPRALRVFASGTVAIHHELTQIGDVDNGLAVIEFEGGARAVILASRTWGPGHETSTEIVGTGGKLLVGAGAARDRVQIGDRAGIRQLAVADFFERFSDAFAREMQAFVDTCLGHCAPPLTLDDAVEATRIGQAITRSLQSKMPEAVV